MMPDTIDTPPRARLHIGSGPVILPGWINVDVKPYPGVDYVLDVVQQLPFSDVEYIFAEHFIEHLPLDDACRFLRHCRDVLRPDGVLRISTPNLDWVWLTHYRDPAGLSPSEALTACLEMNRAFHGWGHKFLYNQRVLEEALHDARFSEIQFHRYGESHRNALRGLERHPRSADTEKSQHVLIAEASGHDDQRNRFNQIIKEYIRDLALD